MTTKDTGRGTADREELLKRANYYATELKLILNSDSRMPEAERDRMTGLIDTTMKMLETYR